MSQNTSYSAETGRMGSVRIARRQLLTARASHDLPPPRVVLHLPDLDALEGVVLGPPKPTAVRRLDVAHTAGPGETHVGRAQQSDTTAAGTQPTLVHWLRGPLKQLAPQLGNGTTLEKLGRLVVLIQQPKVLLATLMAVGLQLAAVLAMLTGNAPNISAPAPTDGHDSSRVVTVPEVLLPTTAQTAGHEGPIRTPASVLGSGGPQLAPTLPPPQSLPGMAGSDIPPWQAAPAAASTSPVAAGPSATQQQPTNKVEAAATPGAGGTTAGKSTRAKLTGTIKRTHPSGATP